MENFCKSIFDSFKNRLTNPVYGTFAVTWMLTNWNFIYSLLFLDQEFIFKKSGILKNEYLWNYFFEQKSLFWQISDHFVIPILLTFLIIYIFPKHLFLPAIKKESEYKTDQRIEKVKSEKRYREEKAKLEEVKAKEVSAVAKQRQAEKIIEENDPTIQWEKEYQDLKKRNIFSHFTTLYQIIYGNNGIIHGQQYYSTAMPLIAYLDSTEALELDGNRIELTSKGSFFMKRYLEGTL